MAKNRYHRGYDNRKAEEGRPRRGKVIVSGTVLLMALVAWLVWQKWQQPVPTGPLPLARNKVVRPIPSAPAKASGSFSKVAQKSTPEQRATLEADLDQEANSLETGEDTPQPMEPATGKGERTTTAESSQVEHGNKTKETFATEDSTAEPAQEEFVVQVGAFRGLAAAEKLQQQLKDKGYDAYLNARTLPNLGLVHRVRIRGYTSVAAAKVDMERIYKEEGLTSIVWKIEPGSTAVSEQ